MDGGGRLDQPLKRSGQSAAERVDAPVEDPRPARVQAQHHDRRSNRLAVFTGGRRTTARWRARIAQLPLARGVGIPAPLLPTPATLGYGSVKGQHLPDVMACFRDARALAANSAAFRIAAIP